MWPFKTKTRSMPVSWRFVGGQLVVGEDNSETYIKQGYKSLPNVYAIISMILSKTSIVPHEILKVKNQSSARKYKAMMKNIHSPKDYVNALKVKNDAFEKAEGTDLGKLLNSPNKYQSTEELYESLDGYLLLTGNSYVWGVSPGAGLNKGKPKELHSLISPTVSIISGDSLYEDPVRAYKVSEFKESIDAENIGHIKYFNPQTANVNINQMLYGMSPLMSCRILLGKYKQADLAQGNSFTNMGISGVLSSETNGTVTEAQAKAIQDKFTNFHTGVANAGKIIATAANVKWNQLGLSPVDLNIIEGKEEILGELCNVFHVPIGMFTKVNSTENNMVESRKMFITDAVIPTVERRKSVLNRFLAPKFGNDLYIDYDYTIFSEMNEDLNELVDAASKMYWITPNEKRQLTRFDKSDNPKMDDIYLPMGIESIDSEIEDIDEDLL